MPSDSAWVAFGAGSVVLGTVSVTAAMLPIVLRWVDVRLAQPYTAIGKCLFECRFLNRVPRLVQVRDAGAVERRADLGVVAVLVATLAAGCGLMVAPAVVGTAVWTALAVLFTGLVAAGITVHRPLRRRPWVLFALMIAAQSPTSVLLLMIEEGRVAAAPANLALGVLLGLSLTLGLAGGVLLVPYGRGTMYRRPLVVVALALTVATVGSAWGVARAIIDGVPSTAAVVNGPLLAVCAAVALVASLLHACRCAGGGLWSEAVLVPFPSLIATANVPAALGLDNDISMRISTVGTMMAFGLVAAAALHPTMTEVARGTVLRLADAPLGLTAWLVGVNAAVAPLVLGAHDHPWLVPLYAAGGGGAAMVYASRARPALAQGRRRPTDRGWHWPLARRTGQRCGPPDRGSARCAGDIGALVALPAHRPARRRAHRGRRGSAALASSDAGQHPARRVSPGRRGGRVLRRPR